MLQRCHASAAIWSYFVNQMISLGNFWHYFTFDGSDPVTSGGQSGSGGLAFAAACPPQLIRALCDSPVISLQVATQPGLAASSRAGDTDLLGNDELAGLQHGDQARIAPRFKLADRETARLRRHAVDDPALRCSSSTGLPSACQRRAWLGRDGEIALDAASAAAEMIGHVRAHHRPAQPGPLHRAASISATLANPCSSRCTASR